ncbi:hypothetical protein BDQ17DRAFT_1354529 [Cyathus striatus]|nr:hypothetical protein BDQ17DRAFT_1354529 [Cyathus striatus]
MSTPPAYNSLRNPDSRTLPSGWITQFDSTYNAWFYVNTHAQPPVTTWEHPLGPPPPAPPPQQFSAPVGPPPPNNQGYNQGGGYGYNNPQGSYGGSGYNNQNGGYPQQSQSPPFGGYNQQPQSPPYGSYPQQQQGSWGSPPPQGGYSGTSGKGGLLGGLFGKHSSGSNNASYGGYPQQQPQVVVAQAPKKSGMGMGTVLAAGGAGLLGGMLIEDVLDNDDDRGGYDDDGYDGGDW